MRSAASRLRRLLRGAALAAAGLSGWPFVVPAAAAGPPVDVELVLAVDISQSMDEEEQRVQRQGYVTALLSDEVTQAIREGPIGRIAVTYVEWGGAAEQYVVADWQIIDDADSARSFAAKLEAAPLKTVQRTSIAAALAFAGGLFEVNGVEGERRVIDISGDGPNNQGGLVTQSRDEIIARGIVINGLPLMMRDGGSWYYLPNLDDYYADCVIGGPGAFIVPVRSLDGFAESIRKKLVLEIAGREPEATVMPAAARPAVACNLYD